MLASLRGRFVENKSVEQQALLSLHRERNLMGCQRTQLIKALRSMSAEFGVYVAKGLARAIGFSKGVLAGGKLELPEIAHDVVHNPCGQLNVLQRQVRWYETRLWLEAICDPRIKLLQTIPGVGPVTASALAVSIGIGHQLKNGREFTAWLGLTPTNRSSGGKERLGRMTKMGGQYLRQLLVVGITSLVRQAKSHPERANKLLTAFLERKPARLAIVAMANKTAPNGSGIIACNADRDSVCGTLQGQRSKPRKQAGHLIASDKGTKHIENVLLCWGHPHMPVDHRAALSMFKRQPPYKPIL
jgi:transposase